MQCSICKEKKEDRVETSHILTLEQKFTTGLKTDLDFSLESYFKSENLFVNCESCGNPHAKER